MKRNLKTLGLALGAMLALGALFAAGASAAGERFHSTEENVIVTGEGGPSKFRTGTNATTEGDGPQVKCKISKYEGTVEGEAFNGETWTSKEVTVHPTYEECEVEGLGEATVDTDGCDFILTSETFEKNTGGEPEHIDKHAPVEVECTHNVTITITATGCQITIGGGFYEGHETEEVVTHEGEENEEVDFINSYGDVTENTLTTGVTYTNIGEGHEKTVTVDSTVDHIPYTSHGFLCGIAGIAKEAHDGFYEDDVIVEGVEDINGPCGVNGTTHVLEGCTHGNHVGIWWE